MYYILWAWHIRCGKKYLFTLKEFLISFSLFIAQMSLSINDWLTILLHRWLQSILYSVINLWVTQKGMTVRWSALLSAKHITFKTPTSMNGGRWIKQATEPEHRFAQVGTTLASLWEYLEWILKKSVFPQTCWEI